MRQEIIQIRASARLGECSVRSKCRYALVVDDSLARISGFLQFCLPSELEQFNVIDCLGDRGRYTRSHGLTDWNPEFQLMDSHLASATSTLGIGISSPSLSNVIVLPYWGWLACI